MIQVRLWTDITDNISAGNMKYIWKIPDICSNQVLFKIFDSNNPLIADTTKLVFTILKPDPNGLVAYYPFNDNSNDEEECHFYNLTTYKNAKLTTDRKNNKNSAFTFDGSSYLYCPDFDYNFNEISVTWWFNLSDLTGKRNFIGLNWQQAAIFELFFWGQFGASYYFLMVMALQLKCGLAT